ncbi:haloacid dehalogenase-like hydrolase [Vibrio sp. JCM 19236]|nr:haloacid dehalogenase-like hydrolase [Vibrio sp. JCM 19236]
MLLLDDYDIYIFDCDGVILDSNELKIVAMKNALETQFSNQHLISECLKYFRENFGKSRFHHINYFIESIFEVSNKDKDIIESNLIAEFSQSCRKLYLEAEVTPGFIEFIKNLPGKKYVASGSEQQELRDVFEKRGLNKYFVQIYGSPTKKSNLIQQIIDDNSECKAVMFGDAISDYQSAKFNSIDFIYYYPLSNVKEEMLKLSKIEKFNILKGWYECQ